MDKLGEIVVAKSKKKVPVHQKKLVKTVLTEDEMVKEISRAGSKKIKKGRY